MNKPTGSPVQGTEATEDAMATKKTRNPIAVALQKRGGSLAGYHGNRSMKGSGKGQGRRHRKHKGQRWL
jgi:hypothetical protein